MASKKTRNCWWGKKFNIDWFNYVPYLRGANQSDCPNPLPADEKIKYCAKHGCPVCKGEEMKNNKTREYCLGCENEGKVKKYCQLIQTIKENNQKLTSEIKNTFAPFYEKIKEAEEQLFKLKISTIQRKITLPENQSFFFLCCSSINYCSLTDSEREQWQEIYKNVGVDSSLDTFSQERDFLVPLAQKYKDIEEQNQKNNIPECKKCQLRREQPTTFPADCEGWCKECIKQKQREKQTPNNNNDDYVPPVNDSPPVNNDNNTPSQDGSPTPSDNSGNGNDTPTTLSDNSPLTQVDNNKNNNQPTKSQKPTSPDNSSNRKSKTDTTTNQFQPIIKYSSLVVILTCGVLIVYFLAKKKKKTTDQTSEK